MSQLTDNLSSILNIKNEIATAITNKGVDMTGKSFPDYPAAISQISGGGGSAVLGTLYATNNGTYNASDLGYDGYSFVDVNVSPMTSYLQGSMNFVNVVDTQTSFVASRAMIGNQEVETVFLPTCINVYRDAFAVCPRLSMVSLPSCNYVREFAFASCPLLSEVHIDNCFQIYDNTFESCTGLVSIEAPSCTFISNRAFLNCTSLRFTSFPMVTKINGDGFNGCTGMSDITLPAISSIGPRAFQNCTGLMNVYLPGLSFCSIYNSTVFDNTNANLTIYVNNQLYNQYITDSNWSWYSSRIVSM
jgi:hypothetical protein